MDVNSTNHWQHLANNSHSNGKGQVNHGVQSNQTIVFSQNVAFPRSSVRSYQHPELNSSSYNTKRADYKKQPATAGAYQCQMQNNQGQTFAEQTQLNQQAGCNVNQQVIQYNINVGNLPEPQTHVNQLVALQKQPSHEHTSITTMQLQQSAMMKGQNSEACCPKLTSQNTQQYVVRRTLVDEQQGSLSAQQYFRSNSAELLLEDHLNQHMKRGAYKSRTQIHSETDKYLNLPSTTPRPFVNIAKGQTTAKYLNLPSTTPRPFVNIAKGQSTAKEQRQHSSPRNQQYNNTFYYSPAVVTQNKQTPHQHAAISTQSQQLPPAYPTIATSFEQQPNQYLTIPTPSQQIPFQAQMQSLNQRLTKELAHLENQTQCTLKSKQTEKVSLQQNQRFSPPNLQECPQIQLVSPPVPNPSPKSSPQLQQPSLGERLTRGLSSNGDMPSTTPSSDSPCDLTLDNLLWEVENPSKTRRNLEEKFQHQQTTTNRLLPFNQKKTPNNENCDDIQIVNCFSAQRKFDSNRGDNSTPQESITMKARTIKRGQLQAPVSKTGDSAAKTVRNNKLWPPHSRVVEPPDPDDATFLLSCSKTTQRKPMHHDCVLPRIVARFLGKEVSEVRSRDYVMYALSDDPRVAEAAIAAHLHESTKMFVCVELPPMSPWSGGALKAKKSYFLVNNARDISRIVAYFPCTSVRVVLVVFRLNQHAERRVQQTTKVLVVDITTSATKERISPIPAQLLQNSSVIHPPAKQIINAPVVSNAKTPPTRPSTVNPWHNHQAQENIVEQGSQVIFSEAPPTLSPTKEQLNNYVHEKTEEQSQDKPQLSSPVNQTRSPSCSIESEEEKMTRIRKEVEALLNAGKPDLRKAAAKQSRGDPELPTLNRHFDVIQEQDDVGTDLDDVRYEHDDDIPEHNDVKAVHDDETVTSAIPACPEKIALNCGKAANQSKDAEIVNLRKRKRASMRAGSCRAPRLDLVYRSYLDSLQPSPIVPPQCAPCDVTITP